MRAIYNDKILPRGAKLLNPHIKKKVGSWCEQEFDAKVERFGITWFRVHLGMGGSGGREDWVADIPNGCLSIHDYQFRKPYWGMHRYKSFDDAIVGQMKECQSRISETIEETNDKLARYRVSHSMITIAIGKS